MAVYSADTLPCSSNRQAPVLLDPVHSPLMRASMQVLRYSAVSVVRTPDHSGAVTVEHGIRMSDATHVQVSTREGVALATHGARTRLSTHDHKSVTSEFPGTQARISRKEPNDGVYHTGWTSGACERLGALGSADNRPC